MEASTKRKLVLVVKLAISVAIMAIIFNKVFERQDAEDLWSELGTMSLGWLGVAALMQLCAIACSVTRWQRLLVGQGIHAPIRHLIGSFMIGRFFGAFTPGGWTGLNGYRIYDIAKHTGKTARAGAAIGLEMILGQLSFGVVVIVGSLFGLRYIGLQGVLLVDAFFVALIGVSLLLLSKPRLFRVIAGRLPTGVRTRVRTLVDAVCAYEGKPGLVLQAILLGVGTHTFNNFIYVATAHALGVDLSPAEVFFVSAMQIFATLVPASLNGVGAREAAAVALYTRVGVPPALAVLIPIVGFVVEMFISAFGGLVFIARRHGYAPVIRVEHPEREDAAWAEVPKVSEERWPRVVRGLAIGFGAGLLAGVLVGLGEGVAVLSSASGALDYGALLYAAVLYGLMVAIGGACAGVMLAWIGRLMKREAVPEPRAYARMTAAVVAVMAFALGAFRVRRDWFQEDLVWKSTKGLLVLGVCFVAASLLYVAISFALRWVIERRPGRVMLRPWGSPLIVAAMLGLVGIVVAVAPSAEAKPYTNRPAAPTQAGNVILIVVDTMRADHLPLYGYADGRTPHLDAFARDAVRFDHAFANASWTRPSFASLLTGRLPPSHNVMAKSDSLPDQLVTLAEAMTSAGYHAAGFVTNYNVAPFFNFQQGFDEYRYLEPKYVLGANDTAAKLLLVQFLRNQIERVRHARGFVEPGTAYQDAQVVNREVSAWLGRAHPNPFFLFVAYMDPHDPYFVHPYNGTGYSRAANPKPRPEEAPRLRQLYDGEITYWDEHFGELVADLQRRGVYDESTIIITSDHGEEFMEHGGYWHGTTLYDEQVRVPLFVKLPHNERAGSVVSHWVQLVDVMPTLLRLNGVDAPANMQGGDLFEGSDEAYAEENHEGNILKALRTRRGRSELKVITANEGNPRGLEQVEIYRVDQDPRERVNLANELPAETDIAQQRLSANASQAARGRVARRAIDATDGNSAAHLRALGYAGGE